MVCTQHFLQDTSRPAHYNVLMDEIGFAVDDLPQFIHSLSYVYAIYFPLINQKLLIYIKTNNSQLVSVPQGN